MQTSSSPQRLAHIDAMRAIAVLLVIWMHYAELFVQIAGSQQIINRFAHSVDFGRVGVVLFFCISGMLIPTSLHGPLCIGTRRFLIRRFLRLYPAYWLSLPLGYLVYWILFDKHMSTIGIFANATMIPSIFGFELVMGHYWTLETELYFYGLCLLLFWCGALQQMRMICTMTLALCLLFVITNALHLIPANAPGQYKGMLFHLAIMFWGACFRQAYDTPTKKLSIEIADHKFQISYRFIVMILAALICALALSMAAMNWHHRDTAHFSTSLGYVVALALFTALTTVLKLHVHFLTRLGEISYSIYLLHGIPLYLTYWICQHFGLTGAPLSLYMLPAFVVTLFMSLLSYRFCEAPAVRQGRVIRYASR
ncbi:acyltransferase family protein [Burkholderia cenocepacia]|uniref:acyltransferase family protein n=1 Tax=Burkholderia cenocepacia TaxID=95486 RepID=UPI002AB6DFF9|nr:acyltransferase [Burkholderia cenocepacia]